MPTRDGELVCKVFYVWFLCPQCTFCLFDSTFNETLDKLRSQPYAVTNDLNKYLIALITLGNVLCFVTTSREHLAFISSASTSTKGFSIFVDYSTILASLAILIVLAGYIGFVSRSLPVAMVLADVLKP